MTETIETPDAVVAALLLEVGGEMAAAPDAAPTDTEMFVGHNAVGSAVEEEQGTGGTLELGSTGLADDATRKAHHTLEGEIGRETVGVSIGHSIGTGQRDDGTGGTAGEDDVVGGNLELGMGSEVGHGGEDILDTHLLRPDKTIEGFDSSAQAATHAETLHAKAIVDGHDGVALGIETAKPAADAGIAAGAGGEAATEDEQDGGFGYATEGGLGGGIGTEDVEIEGAGVLLGVEIGVLRGCREAE